VDRWYVVQTKSQQEERAVANLSAWGLQILAPRTRERRLGVNQQPAYESAALFPGYVFARFDAELLAAKVRYTRGVLGLVGFGAGPAAVDDCAIALIRDRIGADGFVHAAPPRPGDLVHILDGPFRALVGVFEQELSGRDRVRILLTTLGSPLRVQVLKSAIRRAPVSLAIAHGRH
jgi:transcriptional antiterminator RfaH